MLSLKYGYLAGTPKAASIANLRLRMAYFDLPRGGRAAPLECFQSVGCVKCTDHGRKWCVSRTLRKPSHRTRYFPRSSPAMKIVCQTRWVGLLLAATMMLSHMAWGRPRPAMTALKALDLRQVKVGGEIGRRIDVTVRNNLLVLDAEKDFLAHFRARTAQRATSAWASWSMRPSAWPPTPTTKR